MSNYDIMNYQVRGYETKTKLDEDEGSSLFDRFPNTFIFNRVQPVNSAEDIHPFGLPW